MKTLKKRGYLLVPAIFFFLNCTGQTVTLIPSGSTFKYLDNGTNQGTAWRASAFNDVSWPTGNAQFGYGDGDESTVLNYGNDSANKFMTTYFRKSFTISDPLLFSAFKLKILRDDGVLVYLNGKRILVSNMPSAGITYLTPSKTEAAGTAETKFYGFAVSPTLFVAGNNVIAVEVHQFSGSSDDLSFNLILEGTTAMACGTPAALVSNAVTSSGASLSWDPVLGSTIYTIQYRPAGSGTWSNVTTANNSISLNGLWSNTIYEFQVQAVCVVPGAFSAVSNFVTLPGTDTLVNSNSTWKYLDDGSNQGSSWQSSSFTDLSWPTGSAELGYGDGDEATIVSYGPNASVKYITTYFRKSFNVFNATVFSALSLGIVRDDGVVVYLNGVEVYRNNMPTGSISNTTLASGTISGTDESSWATVALNPVSLLSGNNVLAVEIHQVATNNVDISFNARLYASTAQPIVTVTRGAYLQKVTPNSITIRWRTDVACNSKVQFGTTLSYGNSVSDPGLTTEHSVLVSNLNPSTAYYYSIGTTYQVVQGDVKNNFRTAPVSGTISPVRIWATGDFGNGSTAQTAVRDAYTSYTGATPTNLWIWLGDNAYSNGLDGEFQSYVFTKYPDQLKAFPLYPAPGNHDYANVGYKGSSALTTNFPYFSIYTVPQAGEAGGVASGTPKYYSYNYSNIHFISLDSYGSLNSAGSPMYSWLNNDLAANTQRWTIVYFHHPPFSKGTHNSDTESELIDMRTNIVPLLESYHVDLVLSGHSHTNERSYLIKGHNGLATSFNASMKISNSTGNFTKVAPFDGTIYAVCGTSGQGSIVTSSGYPMPCMYFNNFTLNCSLVIDVNGDNLDCKYLTSTGVIADQFTINKVGARNPHDREPDEKSLNAYFNNHELNIVYYIPEDADVKVDLLNLLGEQIFSFDKIPSFQVKGFYQFELGITDKDISNGIYFLRLRANGKSSVKKIMAK